MSQKNRLERRRKEFIENIKSPKNSKRNSIIIGFSLIVVIFIISIILMKINNRSYLYNVNVASFVGLAFSIIWFSIKWGFAEKILLSFHNRKNRKIAKFYKDKIPDSSLDEYRELRSKKSQLGNVILFISMAIILIITVVLQNT